MLKLRAAFTFLEAAPAYRFHGTLSFKIVDTPLSAVVVKTPRIYAEVLKQEWSSGVRVEAVAEEIPFEI